MSKHLNRKPSRQVLFSCRKLLTSFCAKFDRNHFNYLVYVYFQLKFVKVQRRDEFFLIGVDFQSLVVHCDPDFFGFYEERFLACR